LPEALVEHTAGDVTAGVETHQVVLVFDADHVVKIDDRLQGLALGEKILKFRHISPLPFMGEGQGVRAS
jgi:hypothetical protein